MERAHKCVMFASQPFQHFEDVAILFARRRRDRLSRRRRNRRWAHDRVAWGSQEIKAVFLFVECDIGSSSASLICC